MKDIQKTLIKEAGKSFIIAVGIYVILFGLLFVIETVFPSMKGRLLTWTLENGSTNLSFIIGIPASIFGTAYVLTIRNPHNYYGLCLGLVMSVLMGIQLYLSASYDLMFLYLGVYIPFQTISIINWRRAALNTGNSQQAPLTPSFISWKGFWIVSSIFLLICVADYTVSTLFIAEPGHAGDWSYNVPLKISSAFTLAGSILGNVLMIRKRNDALIIWNIASISGIVFFIITGNIFSTVLYIIMLLTNISCQVAWLKNTKEEDWNWAEIGRKSLKKWQERK